MRADRLVAALLLMQSRGRVTATELASELEVSERTARRDLEALSAAGIPVFPQPGRGGGWELIGGARTDLTGLTADEVQVELSYADRQGTESRRVVHPLGLAMKGTVWYLVADTDGGMRTFRV